MSLLKMTILSFSKTGIKQLTDIPQLYAVMFNSNAYNTEFKVNFNEQQPLKTESGKPLPTVNHIDPKKFTFDFAVDGIGAAGFKRDVGLDVKSFLKVVGHDKNIGTDNLRYLLLMWGTFIQKCVIESISVKYPLSSPFDQSDLKTCISEITWNHCLGPKRRPIFF
jgi:hypothetical protein